MTATLFRSLLLSSALTLISLPALARENYALLIGASDYVNIDKRWSLKGPKNDMVLVADYLLGEAPVAFTPENVTVLTDGDSAYQTATLANIRAAFAALTEKAAPGDFIYLHLSGHGTRAPALDPGSEPDGLDELFLPVDIGAWSNTTGAVENALIDDEIAVLLDGLRNKGADVWVVFDACHSGTATRALETGDEVVMRQLEPEALGITEAMLSSAEAGAAGGMDAAGDAARNGNEGGVSVMPKAAAAPAEGVTPGSLVAFYAAQSTEMTPEMRLPRGAPDRKPQGVFTYTLFETLAEYPGATYAQVGQEILRKYATRNAAKSTPLFEGDLERVVFGGEGGGRVAQWPATFENGQFSLNAGSLHGLGAGTELAVMASAADGTEKALGRVRITAAETFTATAEPLSGEGTDLPAELPEGLYLRRTDAALDFSLTVALPAPGTPPADALYGALDALKSIAGPRLNFVAAGEDADLALAVLPQSEAPDALWLLPGNGFAGAQESQPKVATGGLSEQQLAEALDEKLTGIAKALNLLKLSAAFGPSDLDVEVELRTRNAEAPQLRGLPLMPVPTLVTDDEVHILAKNNSQTPVDVNVLYIGADYSISHFYHGRLNPGEELKRGLFAIGGETMGAERVLLVMTPAATHSAIEDLSYLAQDAVRGGGGGVSSVNKALFEAGFGRDTRGALALSDDSAEASAPRSAIIQVELRTRAAE